MAGFTPYAATALIHTVLTTFTKEEHDFAPIVIIAKQSSDGKQVIPSFINRFRIIAIVYSGCAISLKA